jgi:hypothetical protein
MLLFDQTGLVRSALHMRLCRSTKRLDVLEVTGQQLNGPGDMMTEAHKRAYNRVNLWLSCFTRLGQHVTGSWSYK